MSDSADRETGVLWRLVNDNQALFSRLFNQRASDVGLTRPLWQVLAGVYRHPGCTQTALALDLAVGRSPLGKAVDKLEEMGLVERRPDRDDRRANRLFLTAAADRYVRPGQDIIEAIENTVTAALTPAEQQTVTLALSRMREVLEEELANFEASGTANQDPDTE